MTNHTVISNLSKPWHVKEMGLYFLEGRPYVFVHDFVEAIGKGHKNYSFAIQLKPYTVYLDCFKRYRRYGELYLPFDCLGEICRAYDFPENALKDLWENRKRPQRIPEKEKESSPENEDWTSLLLQVTKIFDNIHPDDTTLRAHQLTRVFENHKKEVLLSYLGQERYRLDTLLKERLVPTLNLKDFEDEARAQMLDGIWQEKRRRIGEIDCEEEF